MSDPKTRVDSLNNRPSHYERIPVSIFGGSEEASLSVAAEIADLIRERNGKNQKTVLGLATGSTPIRVYEELIRLHKEEGLSFRNVITYNLDEYYPIEPDSLQSYVRFMREQLFDHIDIDPKNTHIPDGRIDIDRIESYCREYEEKIRKAGGIDIQLLGIGRTGHIGFNEPGSLPDSRTRLVTLDLVTRRDAASDFFGEEHVPRHAITMGVATIMDAKKAILMAWGEGKADIIRRSVEGEITESIPATYLQNHQQARIVLDEASATELTRVKTPWVVSICDWDDKLIRKAVVWLCRKVNKPVLKLTDEDYNEHGMGDLLTYGGPAYNVNLKVFNQLQQTITGWPGGKPDTDDSKRPERASPFPKRAVIFSPHPDDDVISMGGTLIRLVEHGHEVHIAYQTSGNIAVFDDDVIRFADFVNDYAGHFDLPESEASQLLKEVQKLLENKQPGQVDSEEVKKIKGLIRRGEAKDAGRYCGVPEENLHFLDMPFYETGRVKKNPLSDEDIRIIVELLQSIKPNQIYAAGDLSDPHGTHRVCLKAILEALDRLQGEKWLEECYLWLYRGAWQEWSIDQIEMAVPISPMELDKKRRAIFKHQSQKDRPLFPGSDKREFWQRSDDRNRGTAQLYDKLGMAEYEAMEAFVRHRF